MPVGRWSDPNLMFVGGSGRCKFERENQRMKYLQKKDGEWIQPIQNGYKFCCCDCGLVHKLDFRVHKGRIQFRAHRDNRATGQTRRWLKKAKKMAAAKYQGR